MPLPRRALPPDRRAARMVALTAPAAGPPAPAADLAALNVLGCVVAAYGPQRLVGDEPEELEVVPWRLDALGELILREEFSEGRSIAALFIAREWLQQQG